MKARPTKRLLAGIFAFGVTALILSSVISANAASNTIPNTSLEDVSQATPVDVRKPQECASITVTTGSIGTGNFNGTTASELLLGRTAGQTIDGDAGNDCIMAGDGADTLRGNTGNDVILGGPGNDNISGGAGTDICYGNDGTDTFNNDCETRIQ